jgi:endonuclease-3
MTQQDPPRPEVIRERLARAMPTPRCELAHQDAWQLLIATILSAQSTDRGVNRVTPVLFGRWPTPADLAAAVREEVEEVVRPTGFYRQKAKNIQLTAQHLVTEHSGEVPRTMEELVALPGVARKTANVVLGTAYGIPTGMAVDTHARRVSQKLGFTTHKDPKKIEKDLTAIYEQEDWIAMSHRIILHGRYHCTAKKPACARCCINEVCPSTESAPIGSWTDRAKDEGETVDQAITTSWAGTT